MVTATRPPTATLQRTTFVTSRELEFFTEKELRLQIGHGPELWPLALIKELIDNALDACEAATIAPQITVIVTPDAVTVADNGPGLPETTLTHSLDYRVRVSDKSYYSSPTRGQLGNALKCVWAAPFVVSGERGDVLVETNGTRYAITVTLDRIAQQPRLSITSDADTTVKSGTAITLAWPDLASELDGTTTAGFYRRSVDLPGLLRTYALCNPHASFRLAVLGADCCFSARTPTWRKWTPDDPTSPHWYTPDQFRDLLLGYLAAERAGGPARTVRDLVGEFHGLTGTSKRRAVTADADLSGAYLHDLVDGGSLADAPVHRLLAAMQAAARPVQPAALGVLGEEHLRTQLVDHYGTVPESVDYSRVKGTTATGLPFVLEVAFGVSDTPTRAIALNWSPTLRSPLTRLDTLLGEARVHPYDAVAIAVHLACPRLTYLDRGKAQLALPDAIAEALEKSVRGVTRAFTHAKRQADREDRLSEQAWERLRRQHRPRTLNIKDAACTVMAEVYTFVSNGGRLPANARQLMYAARPKVLALTGGKIWSHDSYFTQTLLPDYLNEYPDETRDWDVVFDARGHFREPHTGRVVDLGTVAVRDYIAGWTNRVEEHPYVSLSTDCPTTGPALRYRFALFVEKEGFDPLLRAGRIAERHDLAIMSTKGMSVTAARRLVADLSDAGVTILVMRDFDKAGFAIAHTLAHDTRRFRFHRPPKVVDLGLRLVDAERMGLAGEPVNYDAKVDPRLSLRAHGATDAECAFLVASRSAGGQWAGQRIELNAMASQQLLDWLEEKLTTAGVTKHVPDDTAIAAAYRRMMRLAAAEKAANAAQQALTDELLTVPPDLAQQVAASISDRVEIAWDEALAALIPRQAATEVRS